MRIPSPLAIRVAPITVSVTVLSVVICCWLTRTTFASEDDGTTFSPCQDFTSTAAQKREGFFSNGNPTQWRQEGPQFARLWKQRKTRNIAPELVALLKNPSFSLRDQVVNALGILERPEGEAPLVAEMDKWKKYEMQSREYEKAAASSATNSIALESVKEPNAASRFTIKIALGRIRSRNLKGRAKLNRIAQEIGLNYGEVVKLAQKTKQQLYSENGKERQDAIRSENYKITLAFVDTLYMMGKRGENIKELEADTMAIGPNLQLRLKGATLSSEGEAKMWLDHATNSKIGIFAPSYLLDIGPSAVKLLFERLNDISAHPDKYGISKEAEPRLGLRSLFEAAVESGDAHAVAALKKFEQVDNEQVRDDAAQFCRLAQSAVANQQR